MKIVEFIKAGFFLILVIIAAVFGLQHSFYGLLVNVQNSSLYELTLSNIENEDLVKNRYLKITDAKSISDPLVYTDEHSEPIYYLYALTAISTSDQNNDSLFNSRIILESKTPIGNWKETQIQGLLKPYWFEINEEIILNFKYSGIVISDETEYLQLNSKPWKWYWHTLIILVALLFFYRMFEAFLKNIKKMKHGVVMNDDI